MGTSYSIVALPLWWREGSAWYGKAGFETAAKRANWEKTFPSLKGYKYLVTGANSGIGYECAKKFAELGAEVHMVCRNEERGRKSLEQIKSETKNENVILHLCDISDVPSTKAFAQSFLSQYKSLNGLINNAGVVMNERKLNSTGTEICFATAMGGTFLLTNLLMPALKTAAGAGGEAQRISRVVNVSSGGMYLAKYEARYARKGAYEGKYDGLYAYVQAKRAQVLLTQKFAKLFHGSGVTFSSYHPGWASSPGVKTGQMSWFYEKEGDRLRSEWQGADTAVWLSTSMDPDITSEENMGAFWFDREVQKICFWGSFTSNTEQDVEDLWNFLADLYGVPGK